jgi:hypothetical protein
MAGSARLRTRQRGSIDELPSGTRVQRGGPDL